MELEKKQKIKRQKKPQIANKKPKGPVSTKLRSVGVRPRPIFFVIHFFLER
jgi:hypothetical protein